MKVPILSREMRSGFNERQNLTAKQPYSVGYMVVCYFGARHKAYGASSPYFSYNSCSFCISSPDTLS